MPYTHLTPFERSQIEVLLQAGWSLRAAAREMGRNPSTISRELRRNGDGRGRVSAYSLEIGPIRGNGELVLNRCRVVASGLDLPGLADEHRCGLCAWPGAFIAIFGNRRSSRMAKGLPQRRRYSPCTPRHGCRGFFSDMDVAPQDPGAG
jgi:hypothetical protein